MQSLSPWCAIPPSYMGRLADRQVSVCLCYVSVLRLACSDLDDTVSPHLSATLLRCPALVTSELGSETS